MSIKMNLAKSEVFLKDLHKRVRQGDFKKILLVPFQMKALHMYCATWYD